MLKKLVFLSFLLMPCFAQAASTTSPEARVFDLSGHLKSDFIFFDESYSGSVDMSLADVDGDGRKDILFCSGAGSKAMVKSYDYAGGKIGEFQAYGDNFLGGCYLSASDMNSDGKDEVITGAGFGGGPQVKIFSDSVEQRNFFAYSDKLRQGVRVAADDLGGDGKSEIIAFSNYNAPAGYAIFGNDGHKIAEYQLKDLNANGISLSAGDFNGDGAIEFAIAGGYGNKPEIRIYGAKNELLKTITYHKSEYLGGLNLSAADINGDKKDEIIISKSFNGSGEISAYDFGGAKVLSFIAFEGGFSSGVKTAVGDVNGDGRLEIVAVPERVGASLSSGEYKFITVDLSRQTLYRFQNGALLDSFLISSGKAGTPTPKGDYAIYRKRPLVRMSWYFGPNSPLNYDLPNVPWVASFSGPFTLHGTYWHNNFGHPMSHGCVNMYTPDAKTVYEWADIGTPIEIY